MTASTATTSISPQTISGASRWWDRLRYVGITGMVVAVVLSVAGWWLVMNDAATGSVAAAIGVLFMTAPVVLARRQPLVAVTVVTLAAVVNGLLWDDVVRCGAAVPALLYITFAVGSRSRIGGRGWGWPVLGLMIALGSAVAQRVWDPALDSDALPFIGGLVLLAWLAGLGWAAIEPRLTRRAG